MEAIKKELPLIQCGTCLWWLKDPETEDRRDDDDGLCMLHPPVISPVIHQEIIKRNLGRADAPAKSFVEECMMYPATWRASYCGEWRANDPAMRKRLGSGEPPAEPDNDPHAHGEPNAEGD